jgi:methylated-DNA-[protein]-cysteine S-methyltransferase
MKRRTQDNPDFERWLDGGPAQQEAAQVGRRLDDVYAAGPPLQAWPRAEKRLHATLASAGSTVFYDRARSSLVGPLWVAVSELGLVAVEFDGKEADFAAHLRRRTGKMTVRSAEKTREARREIESYLEGRTSTFAIPVDLSTVTPFQRQVLEEARRVPRGQVATYGQIARRIGRPHAARAIGQALGSNPVPIVVPCHRVLASDGTLGGYSGRGGIRTKRRLLQLEGAFPPG